MKKILITVSSILCILLFIPQWMVNATITGKPNVMGGCDSSQFQYGEDLIDWDIIKEGMGANLIDTSKIVLNSDKNILYLNAWLEVSNFKNNTYYLTLDGVKTKDQDLYLLVSNYDDFSEFQSWQISMISDSACLYGIPGEDQSFDKDIKYITFVIYGGSQTFDKDVEYYKDKVYLNNANLMPNYYTPYFYDSSCMSYSESRTNGIVENDFVVSTSLKVNVDNLAKSIKASDNYCVTLVSDEYTNNYNIAGKYTITFNVTKDNKSETIKFVATVISLGSVTYNKSDDASYTYNVSTNIGALEFIENLPSEIVNDFTFDLSSGIVKRRFVFEDADITGDGTADKITCFQEICKVPGTYQARWEVYSNINGERVESSYNLTITIVDDSKFEVFVPKFVIYLNPLKTYTQEELANQIKNLLIVNNIFDETSTVSITSNEYEENSTSEGEYKVGYRVSQGDHIYDESCTVNVSLNNNYDPEIVITNDSKFNPSIIYITITIVLVLGISTYFVIKKVKNRKNR